MACRLITPSCQLFSRCMGVLLILCYRGKHLHPKAALQWLHALLRSGRERPYALKHLLCLKLSDTPSCQHHQSSSSTRDPSLGEEHYHTVEGYCELSGPLWSYIQQVTEVIWGTFSSCKCSLPCHSWKSRPELTCPSSSLGTANCLPAAPSSRLALT